MKNLIPLILYILCISASQAQEISFVEVAAGFNDPIDIQNAGDDRLFIVEQGGIIKILNSDFTTNATPFLNISSLVSGGGEQGLLGLAFHPDYATNGFFFLNYTKTNGDSRIARYSVDPGDPDIALSGSELVIIEYAQPFSNHNGGGIVFGPDGFLYIGTGDGGSGGDPGNRAQNTTLLLGKLLRLDIDNPTGGNEYGIPADNPFAGSMVDREEIWAYGLRNPWRFSFDSETDDLWIGDVGQQNVEEIDRAGLTESGLNYGWRCYEGSDPFNTSGCPPMGDLTFPIAEYSSASGTPNCSITGGYVYRGSEYPNEQGLYMCADVCSGKVFTVDDAGNITDWGSQGGTWVSFGVDVNNELYIADLGGEIHKFEGSEPLSVDEFISSEVAMVPNPTSDQITITSDKMSIATIIISDLKGSILISEENINSKTKSISLSQLSAGLYITEIRSENGNSLVKKLIIQ
jgi:glucose/arabinose dehydrogenase